MRTINRNGEEYESFQIPGPIEPNVYGHLKPLGRGKWSFHWEIDAGPEPYDPVILPWWRALAMRIGHDVFGRRGRSFLWPNEGLRRFEMQGQYLENRREREALAEVVSTASPHHHIDGAVSWRVIERGMETGGVYREVWKCDACGALEEWTVRTAENQRAYLPLVGIDPDEFFARIP
ncbi:hypothetical protein [Agromyces sp. GXS1127]|uniref:hypothetical protein n=1 Tax=Agromyces sp. GXS1127 TaxID=3424181 RepID=UPI003D31192D